MNTKRTIVAAIALAGVVASAEAQETKMNMVDFLVDWQSYIGKKVRITGGEIAAASPTGAVLTHEAGYVFLSPPWLDKENLRYVLRYCPFKGAVPGSPACQRTVSGTVTAERRADLPNLNNLALEP